MSTDEVIYTKRQQKIVDAAEKAVADAELEIEDIEDDLRCAKLRLKDAKRSLYAIHEMGDML